MKNSTLKTVLGALMISLSSGLLLAQEDDNIGGTISAASSGDTNTVVEVRTPDPTALVGTSTASFTLIRTGPTNSALAVGLTFTGTATNGVDFAPVLTTVSIPAGALALDIPIQPIVVPTRHGNKTVKLTITNSAAFMVGIPKSGTVTLIDDVFNLSPPTISIVSPTNGTTLKTPVVLAITVDIGASGASLKQVSYYADDDLIGRATSSPWGLSWTNPPVGSFSLFARALDQSGHSTLSQPVQITITNVAPTVSLLSPTNGATYNTPQNVPIKVQFADPDGTVTGAVIYGDGRQLGTVTSSPGSLIWTNVGFGRHTIVARVQDSVGQRASAQASFTILETLPSITVTAPKNGTNFHAPASIEIDATASNPVKTMEFWFDGRRIGESTAAPYQYTVTNVRAGFHSLYTVGVDNYGKRARSATVYVSVSN
jgi:hypothetical protein